MGAREGTIRDGTVRDGVETVRETGVEGATIREASDDPTPGGSSGEIPEANKFRVIRRLAARRAEADIAIVKDNGGHTRVLKYYRLGIEPDREALERYERISRECPEHIVRVFRTGQSRQDGRWYEVLEYIENGSVADCLEKGAKLDFRQFVRQLTAAVKALRERGIVHRDLKPGNILVRSTAPLDLVLADCGIASALDGASVREAARKGLTPMYAAPEDTLGNVVSRPADWWACGMIFYEILLGFHPFKDLSASRVAYILSTRGVEIDPALPEHERLLLSGLLTRDDRKRWGLDADRGLAGRRARYSGVLRAACRGRGRPSAIRLSGQTV
ncbi:MAG: protein kinase [Desulfovibrio sp.]|nr:protein kinase [Desulfovibrio sp.]